MKKYAEVISSEPGKTTLRVYREEEGELYPTALTLTSPDYIASSPGDTVLIEFNTLLFYSVTLTAYSLPFVLAYIIFRICGIFTDNVLIRDCALLLSLPVIYFSAAQSEKLPGLKNLRVCKILELIEE